MRNNSIFLFLIVLLLTTCQPAEKTAQPDPDFVAINKEVLLHSQAYSTLQEATTSIGHRLTGSANGGKAEEYVYNKLKEYGYNDVRYEEFEVEAWSRGKVQVSIDGVDVPAVTLGHSPIQADVSGAIIDTGNGLEQDYATMKTKVKGKIALIYLGLLEGSDKGLHNLHRKEKTTLAIQNGAIGAIFYNSVPKGVLLTGTASSTGALIPIPAVCISKEAGLELRSRLATTKASAHMVMTNHNNRIKARNVIATVKGSELPGERVILAGHLDSWDLATGAIDNGIGSFAVLDIARSFKASKLVPRRTVQFILFMGEEQGLLGSRFHVKNELQKGSIDSVKYMMNIDMGGNPIGIQAGGDVKDTTFFKSVGSKINEIDTVFRNQFKRGSGLHSDHQPFMLEGIPILGIIGHLDRSVYDCYHADCDNFNLVNEEHLRNTVRFGAMILYSVANAEELPAHKMDSDATRQFLIDNNLKESLVIDGDWKWEK